MKILITGAGGFVGKNLTVQLENIRDGRCKNSLLVGSDIELMLCEKDTSREKLEGYCRDADFVIHLAGVNRPKDEAEFQKGNADFTGQLLALMKKYENKAPILMASSIQAELDNPYGRSKKAGEDLLRAYGEENETKVLIYRFTNLFGKWCRPNYNSVVATFCHNIAHGLPIAINDPDRILTLTYIDDVIDELIRALVGREHCDGSFCFVPVTSEISLGELAEMLQEFRGMRTSMEVPNMGDRFEKKLYATYLSYLPAEDFKYSLKMNTDDRGSFTEIIRTPDRGQFSVNISKPGITKGQHWHHTKNEKFVVVSGHGLMQLRKIGTNEEGKPYPVAEFEVTGESLDVVEMIPGYTHNIINLSETEDLITFIWANEPFDANRPDTYFEPV